LINKAFPKAPNKVFLGFIYLRVIKQRNYRLT
jgi:hypothetical protein